MKISFCGASDDALNQNAMNVPEEVLQLHGIETLADVISYVYDEFPRARKSFYRSDGTLSNGTICLIDEQDADMLEFDKQKVSKETDIVFISTLHGG